MSGKDCSANTNDEAVETPPRRATRAVAAAYNERLSSSSSSLRGGGENATSRQKANGNSKNGRSHPRDTTNLTDLMDDLKLHIDRSMAEGREQSRRDFDRLLTVLQQESAKRTIVEGRLHAQLLLQSETMVALELKLLKLEAKVDRREREYNRTQSQSRAAIPRPLVFSRIEESPGRTLQRPPSNVISSTASLASGVTASSLLEDGGEDDETGHDEDSSNATPTHRVQVAGGNLESILLKPMIGETDGTSTRATRGDALTDAGSSLATSVTNSTFTSTVVTATTRGTHPQLVQLLESNDDEAGAEESGGRPPRSRSQSPLTVQSASVGGDYEAIAMGSVTGPGSGAGSIASERTILTTGAVAPNRVNRSSRALANRVVSFDVMMQPQPSGEAGGDSITMPDELDNLSEVADTFAASARLWRDEYEARLDALQKRFNSEG